MKIRINNKKNKFIGTIRVYNINEETDTCDQGSFIIDEEQAESAPLALEAELLTLNFIFENLQIGNVVNENRADNKVMNNLTRKLGFVFKKDIVINGAEYKYFLLNAEDYKRNREKFRMVIDYWADR